MDPKAGWLIDWAPKSGEIYTRAGAGEVLPDPVSPLAWTLVWERGALQGWARGLVEFGFFRPEEVAGPQPAFAGLFGGYFFLNLTQQRRQAVRMGVPIPAFERSLLGYFADDVPSYQESPEDSCEECSEKIQKTMGWVMSTDEYPELDADRQRATERRATRPQLASLSDAELVERARDVLPEIATSLHRHIIASFAASIGSGLLHQVCQDLERPERAFDLISGFGNVDSSLPTRALWDLSRIVAGSPALTDLFNEGRYDTLLEDQQSSDGEIEDFRSQFQAFIAEFGHRGDMEYDIQSASWESEPSVALGLVDQLRAQDDDFSPTRRSARLAERRQEAIEEIRATLSDDEAALGQFEAALQAASFFLPAKEIAKGTMVMNINEVRVALLELGSRAAEGGHLQTRYDVTMLVADELDDFIADPSVFTEVIRERREQFGELSEHVPPFIVEADDLDPSRWTRDTGKGEALTPLTAGGSISGGTGCNGSYTGQARIVLDPAEPGDFKPGEVLVVPHADVAWTPLFLVAGAIIVDTGSANSHAIVVCRELGTPCVVSAHDATSRIPDGALVTVNGNEGKLVLESLPGGVTPVAIP